jgi:hypothetical protein
MGIRRSTIMLAIIQGLRIGCCIWALCIGIVHVIFPITILCLTILEAVLVMKCELDYLSLKEKPSSIIYGPGDRY